MYNLGQYLPGTSPVHKCDPRIKIIALLLLSLLILRLNFLGLGMAYALVLGIAVLGKISRDDVWRASRPVWPLFLVLFLMYLFFTSGTPLLPLWGSQWYISREGLSLGILQVSRFWLLVLAAALLTMTTSLTELTVGMHLLLKPMRIVRISSHNIAMMVSLAVRFVPALQMEMNLMREAQAARGANFRSWRAQLRLLRYLTIPLTINIMRRSDELIEAMEARGYQPGPRTYLYEPALTRNDYLIITMIILSSASAWWWRGLILI